MRILFDASVHLGQFHPTSDEVRVACKNSQISISTKPEKIIIAIAPFNENSWVDHIIWDLERDEQDIFYPFMDVFHSVKQIDRIPINQEDAKLALTIMESTGVGFQDALTCAVAVSQKASAIHTVYVKLLSQNVIDYMKEHHQVQLMSPELGEEMNFTEPNLEDHYQHALRLFREKQINLIDKLANSRNE